MKFRQFGLVVAGILVICIPAIEAGKSTSGVLPVTTASDGSAAVYEWYGPFASWDNVKTKYGAVGDGVADDTAALSNALANVGVGANSPVLYFPAGTYRVTHKLWLRNRQYVEIRGEDPRNTILIYDGATDANYSGPSTLFHADAVNECYFARLTFDGNGKSKTVVSESESSGWTYFDADNSWEDCIVKNSASGGHGFDAGYFGDGFASIDFVRCVFTNHSSGLVTYNWNAMDGWLTDCYMVNCGTAIDIITGSSHAYHTAFVNNQTDFLLKPAAVFISLVSNVSYHAGVFFKANNVGLNLTPVLLKGNTVIDPTGGVPIVIGQPGPVMMLDNVIANTNGAAVSFSNGLQVDLLAVGNTNVVSNWLSIGSGSGLKTNLVDNYVVSRGALTLNVPPLPTAATNLNRTVINLAANFTAADLQNTINTAADGTVIHIPWASNAANYWYINQVITVPSNKDVRIVGDGFRTKLYWNGTAGGAMFSLPHPSRATFGHLQLFGGNNGGAGALVSVNGVGTSAARVYLRDAKMTRGINANVRLGDCPNTVIDYYGTGAGGAADAPAHGSNFILDGRGKAKYINADGGGAIVSYVCTNGGSLHLETTYDEAGNTFDQKIFRVSGSSTVTFLCGKLVQNIGGAQDFGRATSNGFAVVDFSGKLFMGLEQGLIDWYNISGATTGAIWIHGSETIRSPQTSTWPIINSTADTPVQTMNWDGNNGIARYGDVGGASAAYVRQMLSQARAEYSDRSPMARRANQTDVLLEHVLLELGQQNLWVKP